MSEDRSAGDATALPPNDPGALRFEDDADAPVRCDRCGRPFADESLLALHRGVSHAPGLTDDERGAYRTAYEAEEEEIRLFRLKALGALVLLYFGFLWVYALV